MILFNCDVHFNMAPEPLSQRPQASLIDAAHLHPVTAPLRELVITPPRGLAGLDLREIYEARYLLWNLIRRNAKVPYLDLSFGVFWTLLRPVLFVFVFFFIKQASNADMKTGLEYVLYVYSGLILWWYFVNATIGATKSIYKDASLITKVYYPRILSPVAPVISGFTDFAIMAVLLPVGMIAFNHHPDWHIILLPLPLLQVMIMALGLGFLTAGLSIESRDYMSIQRYILYIGMFLSPVIYSPDLLAERFRGLYYFLNPMAAPLELFRVALFSGVTAPWGAWAFSAIVSLVILAVGLYTFRRAATDLADKVL